MSDPLIRYRPDPHSAEVEASLSSIIDAAVGGVSGQVLYRGASVWGTTTLAALGGGSVTSVSVVTANGISGSVATATTTPAITLTLGAITPTSVSASGTVTGSNLSGTNTGDMTTPITVANGGTGLATLSQYAVLLGAATSVLGAATIGTAGRVLLDNGAGANPSFSSTGIVIATHTAPITVDTPGATVTFNLGLTDWHQVTLDQATTFALSNPSTGQVFYIKIIQGASNWGATWFTTITWGTSTFAAPTLPATAGKWIICGFRCTGSNTYDGFVVGASGA